MKYLRKPFKYTYKNAVLIIALINAGVFVFTSLFRNLSAYLGLVPILVVEAQTYWQFFTYQFVHGDFFHLAFNMLALFFFGSRRTQDWNKGIYTLLSFDRDNWWDLEFFGICCNRLLYYYPYRCIRSNFWSFTFICSALSQFCDLHLGCDSRAGPSFDFRLCRNRVNKHFFHR